jgi:hypothetical protein
MRTSSAALLLKLIRYSFVVTILLGWASPGRAVVATAAASSCNYNSFCEPESGENCNDCTDCGCVCGNNTCDPGESCQGCPEDCDSECICGDAACNWPAEAGGYPNDGCEEAHWYYPNTTCTYCPWDCGFCDNDLCVIFENQVCSESGGCAPCDPYADPDQCAEAFGDYMCSGSGDCIPAPRSGG